MEYFLSACKHGSSWRTQFFDRLALQIRPNPLDYHNYSFVFHCQYSVKPVSPISIKALQHFIIQPSYIPNFSFFNLFSINFHWLQERWPQSYTTKIGLFLTHTFHTYLETCLFGDKYVLHMIKD